MILIISKHFPSKKLNWKQLYSKLFFQRTATYALLSINPIMTKIGLWLHISVVFLLFIILSLELFYFLSKCEGQHSKKDGFECHYFISIISSMLALLEFRYAKTKGVNNIFLVYGLDFCTKVLLNILTNLIVILPHYKLDIVSSNTKSPVWWMSIFV